MTSPCRLTALDWAIVALYFVAMLAIGWRYKTFANRSLENYFLAGRNLPGWATGLAYAAAMMSPDAAAGYGGLTSVTGLYSCWSYLTRFGLPLFIGAVLFAVFWRRLKIFTAPEFYEVRFGGWPARLIRVWIALRSSLIALVAFTGITLLALCKLSQTLLGLDKTATLLITLPVAILYLLISGYMGLVVTNVVQMAIMFLGMTVLAVMVLVEMGGPMGLAGAVSARFGEGVLSHFPPVDDRYFPLAAGLAWLVGMSVGYGGDAAPLGGAMEGQRILSSRSPAEACKMFIVTEISLFVMVLAVSLPCLGAIVLWPELRTGGMDRELAYGMLMAKFLGPGLLGLVFTAMVAAMMSTVDDNLNLGSQFLLNDVYRTLVPGATERHYLWVGKAFMVLILGLCLVVVYHVEYLFDVAIFMVGMSIVELPGNWAQWWWWRFNRWGRLTASFGGALIYVGTWFLFKALGIAWWWQLLAALGATTALWVLVTLLTPPEERARLAAFHDQARPLGSWSPFRRAGDRDRGWGVIARGLGLSALGAGSVMSLIVGLSDLYVGRYSLGGVLVLASLGAGLLFYRLFSPFLAYLTEEPEGGETRAGALQEERMVP